MRFVEDRAAGWGVREFRNLDPPNAGKRPGHLDLGWSRTVRQVGTRQTGLVEHVTVTYGDGETRRFKGAEADKILRAVQESRSDVEALHGPASYETAYERYVLLARGTKLRDQSATRSGRSSYLDKLQDRY